MIILDATILGLLARPKSQSKLVLSFPIIGENVIAAAVDAGALREQIAPVVVLSTFLSSPTFGVCVLIRLSPIPLISTTAHPLKSVPLNSLHDSHPRRPHRYCFLRR